MMIPFPWRDPISNEYVVTQLTYDQTSSFPRQNKTLISLEGTNH